MKPYKSYSSPENIGVQHIECRVLHILEKRWQKKELQNCLTSSPKQESAL